MGQYAHVISMRLFFDTVWKEPSSTTLQQRKQNYAALCFIFHAHP